MNIPYTSKRIEELFLPNVKIQIKKLNKFKNIED